VTYLDPKKGLAILRIEWKEMTLWKEGAQVPENLAQWARTPPILVDDLDEDTHQVAVARWLGPRWRGWQG
jgi:hypothetical protein